MCETHILAGTQTLQPTSPMIPMKQLLWNLLLLLNTSRLYLSTLAEINLKMQNMIQTELAGWQVCHVSVFLVNSVQANTDTLFDTTSSFHQPPVTSHMGVMGESSGGTPPRGSGSTDALPGIRSTRANRRWSQRKGSLVSSLPGSGVVRGRCS